MYCFGLPNQPPEIPTITGSESGEIGIEYTYFASTSDPDEDPVEYWFDWGDGFNTGWQSDVSASHIWESEGDFTIKVKARDDEGAESDWGMLQVSMPKSKVFLNPFQWIFNNFQRYLRRDPPASWLEGSDQVQTICGEYGFVVSPLFSCAQEFKPSKSSLTAVALPFFKFGSPPSGTTITVKIREDLNGEDLTSTGIDVDSWRIKRKTWTLFDFNDIGVIADESYYIVCIADKGDYDENNENNTHVYCWNFEFDNQYGKGIAFQTNESGDWHDLENHFDDPEYVECDFAFITYYQEPKSKMTVNLFLRFLENHPRLFPIIQLLLT
jgi:hypothetical protein